MFEFYVYYMSTLTLVTNSWKIIIVNIKLIISLIFCIFVNVNVTLACILVRFFDFIYWKKSKK